MTVFIEEIGMEGLLRDVATMVQPLMARNGNRFILHDCPDLRSVRSDQKKLSQILYNLLDNASKFTREGTITLRVQLDADPAFFMLTVQDQGIGMSATDLSRLFQEFSQADASTTRKYSGTGLGLALCRRFAELLGGQVWAESEPGKGSVFHVRLPIRSESRHPVPREIPPTSGHRGTVLVIDDEFTMRDTLSRLFTKEGYWVAVASTGAEGLQMARSLNPDLITLDILMPGSDGWEVLRQLKSVPELKEIPVILLSVLGDCDKGLALGAAAVCRKPVDRGELMRLIDTMPGLAGTSPAPG